jgi:uncharacterized membrane protein
LDDVSDTVFDTVQHASTDALISEMKDRIQSLERHLDHEREANKENRRIIAALTSRIPEIEPSRESPPAPREWPETAEGVSYGTSPQEAQESLHHTPYDSSATPQEAEQSLQTKPRSWWDRFASWFNPPE